MISYTHRRHSHSDPTHVRWSGGVPSQTRGVVLCHHGFCWWAKVRLEMACCCPAAMVSQMIAFSFYEVASSELSSFWFAWIWPFLGTGVCEIKYHSIKVSHYVWFTLPPLSQSWRCVPAHARPSEIKYHPRANMFRMFSLQLWLIGGRGWGGGVRLFGNGTLFHKHRSEKCTHNLLLSFVFLQPVCVDSANHLAWSAMSHTTCNQILPTYIYIYI